MCVHRYAYSMILHGPLPLAPHHHTQSMNTQRRTINKVTFTLHTETLSAVVAWQKHSQDTQCAHIPQKRDASSHHRLETQKCQSPFLATSQRMAVRTYPREIGMLPGWKFQPPKTRNPEMSVAFLGAFTEHMCTYPTKNRDASSHQRLETQKRRSPFLAPSQGMAICTYPREIEIFPATKDSNPETSVAFLGAFKEHRCILHLLAKPLCSQNPKCQSHTTTRMRTPTHQQLKQL